MRSVADDARRDPADNGNEFRSTSKAVVARFWDEKPCGARLATTASVGSEEFFRQTEAARYALEPFIPGFARFAEAAGKRLLEVGCGTGTDVAMFARHGADVWAIDLTRAGAGLATKRLRCEGIAAHRVAVGDAERLPFADESFDVVYSWGVIHHTPDTLRAAREIVRVARPGARIVVMIYHRASLVVLQAYVRFALLRMQPFRSAADVVASHIESPGTKAYSVAEARAMFSQLHEVSVTPIVTRYDLRVARNRFLPFWLARLVPARLGWFLVVEGVK